MRLTPWLNSKIKSYPSMVSVNWIKSKTVILNSSLLLTPLNLILYWLINFRCCKFRANWIEYAPLFWKEENLGFDFVWKTIKLTCVSQVTENIGVVNKVIYWVTDQWCRKSGVCSIHSQSTCLKLQFVYYGARKIY